MAERNNERNRGVNKIICTSMGKESTKSITAEKTRRNEKQRKESPINCEMKETKRATRTSWTSETHEGNMGNPMTYTMR